jgi:hypothetical protein
MSILPFTPGATVSRAVTSSSARVALPTTRGNQILVTSPGGEATTSFIKFGASDVVAVATDTPILAGTVQVFSVPPGNTHVAAINASGAQTLYFTGGDGQ